jgi:hypothetical protein
VAFLAVLALTGCSLLLDFDLTGNSPADASSLDGGGSETTTTPSDATTASDGDGAPGGVAQQAPFSCGPSFDICDGFERPNPVGESFLRLIGPQESVRITTTTIASDLRSLEVVRPQAAAAEEVLLASEGHPFPQNKGHFLLQIWFAISYDPNTFVQDRTLIIIRPTATIDAPGEPRVKVVMRTAGVFIEARQFTGPAWKLLPIPKTFNLTDGRYHSFAIDVNFVDGTLVFALDGVENVFNETNLTLLDTALEGSCSFAFGASTDGAGGAITTRFDNVRVRHN